MNCYACEGGHTVDGGEPNANGTMTFHITCRDPKYEVLRLGVLLRAPDGWEHVGDPKFLPLPDQPEMVAVKYHVRRPL